LGTGRSIGRLVLSLCVSREKAPPRQALFLSRNQSPRLAGPNLPDQLQLGMSPNVTLGWELNKKV
jgi:hypothetical protein